MSLSVNELIQIKDLPDFLRADHCYNDLQHAMLVILFRHFLTALLDGNSKYADNLVGNITLYLYVHFLNEEEGMAFNATRGLVVRDELITHSEMHLDFLDYWKLNVLIPYNNGTLSSEQIIENVRKFYNLIITHINETDKPTYGPDALSIEQTRSELARISSTNMPMSPFMSGAFETVGFLDRMAAESLNKNLLSPQALRPLPTLNLVENVGRILSGAHGSLRDRFAIQTGGDLSAKTSTAQIYLAA